MIVRAGGALDPKDKVGLADLAASLLDAGHDDQVGDRAERGDRLHRRRDGRRRRHRSELRQHDRDEGQLRGRPAHAVRHGAASGVRAGGDRAAAPADAVGPAGQLRRSRSSSPTPCSSGWSTASIRTACRRPARPRRSPRITRDDLRRVSPAELRAEQRDSRRSSATSPTRRRSTASTKVFGDWERREVPRRHVRSRRPIRRGASSSSTSPTPCRPRCASGTSAIRRNHADYMALNLAIRILGGEGANRLHQVLRTERGLTYGAQADMDTLQRERRLRGGDQHALGGDRRSAAADGGRVLAAAARAGRRARARRTRRRT